MKYLDPYSKCYAQGVNRHSNIGFSTDINEKPDKSLCPSPKFPLRVVLDG